MNKLLGLSENSETVIERVESEILREQERPEEVGVNEILIDF